MTINAQGITQEQMDKLKALMQETAFMEEVASRESAREVQALFRANGVSFTEEEAGMILRALDAAIAETAELKEKDLDTVSGGGFNIFRLFWNVNGNSLLVNLSDRCAMIRLRLLNRGTGRC